jgi:hypothetical protein
MDLCRSLGTVYLISVFIFGACDIEKEAPRVLTNFVTQHPATVG